MTFHDAIQSESILFYSSEYSVPRLVTWLKTFKESTAGYRRNADNLQYSSLEPSWCPHANTKMSYCIWHCAFCAVCWDIVLSLYFLMGPIDSPHSYWSNGILNSERLRGFIDCRLNYTEANPPDLYCLDYWLIFHWAFIVPSYSEVILATDGWGGFWHVKKWF